jgi:uncharacterized membrane protein YgdD (TMEM256/DUF423 family)
MTSESSRFPIALGAFFGFTGVMTGALGAHAFEDSLAARGMTTVWQTAVLYHLIHTLALFALGVWCASTGNARARSVAGWCWAGGILLFSGSLYLLALGGPSILGPVTPFGGLLLMAGWVAIFISAFRSPRGST